jgi:hypothetical protein
MGGRAPSFITPFQIVKSYFSEVVFIVKGLFWYFNLKNEINNQKCTFWVPFGTLLGPYQVSFIRVQI